jgi:hypothetical protein
MKHVLPVLLLTFILSACGGETPEPTDADTNGMAGTESAADTTAASVLSQGENLAVPTGWLVRADDESEPTVGANAEDADAQDIYFVNMTPGWHITMGRPRGILWHPDLTGTGAYTASTKIHLFDPGERREGYGLFIGGSDLQGPDQEYLYFLIRRTGEYIIKIRRGSETETVVDWTAHDAIVPYTDATEGTAENTLSVMVMDGMTHFQVNGQDVHVSTDKSLPTQGVVGLRLNHGLNVHVESLSVE